MKNPRLYIENTGTGPKMIAGRYTKIFLLVDDEDGNAQRVDISMLCRAADVRLHTGEAVMARLEMFLTGFESNAELEELVLQRLKPRRWWRRFRDVTTLASRAQEWA